jgi:hypothetical protein
VVGGGHRREAASRQTNGQPRRTANSPQLAPLRHRKRNSPTTCENDARQTLCSQRNVRNPRPVKIPAKGPHAVHAQSDGGALGARGHGPLMCPGKPPLCALSGPSSALTRPSWAGISPGGHRPQNYRRPARNAPQGADLQVCREMPNAPDISRAFRVRLNTERARRDSNP